MDRVFTFFAKKKAGTELSNFFECYVEIAFNGLKLFKYNSGESAYHGMKYITIAYNINDDNRKKILINYGEKFEIDGEFGNLSQNEIKKKGGKKGFKLEEYEREQWNILSIDIQKQICLYKFNNYSNIKDVLLSTKGKILIHPAMRVSIEKVKDRLWEGRAIINPETNKLEVIGQNMLGKIWMEIRDTHVIPS